MNKLAIDVVLLPSERMMDHVITVNEKLLQQNLPKIILNKVNCLPHISLLMGCITETFLPQISQILSEIGRHESVFQLQITEAKVDTMPDGKPVTVLNVAANKRLEALHEALINQLKPFLSFDATPQMLFNPPEVEEITLPFINNYLKNFSFTNFSPHITAGIGAYNQGSYPIPFTAPTLALCQLGNYCTCRKVLHAVTLGA